MNSKRMPQIVQPRLIAEPVRDAWIELASSELIDRFGQKLATSPVFAKG